MISFRMIPYEFPRGVALLQRPVQYQAHPDFQIFTWAHFYGYGDKVIIKNLVKVAALEP